MSRRSSSKKKENKFDPEEFKNVMSHFQKVNNFIEIIGTNILSKDGKKVHYLIRDAFTFEKSISIKKDKKLRLKYIEYKANNKDIRNGSANEENINHYIDPEEFKKIMNFGRDTDAFKICGNNWIDKYRIEKTIAYDTSYDSIYREYISISDFEKQKLEYERYIDGNVPENPEELIELIEFVVQFSDNLIKDPSAKIIFLDENTQEIVLQGMIDGASSMNIKLPVSNIIIITIGDFTQYNRLSIGEIYKDMIIQLKPLDENNYGSTEESIKDLMIKAKADLSTIKRHIKNIYEGIKKLGNNEYVSGSIQCWIATRINNASDSVVCDYTMPKMVKYIDEEVRKHLSELIDLDKPLTIKELIEIYGQTSGELHIVHNNIKIPITKRALSCVYKARVF